MFQSIYEEFGKDIKGVLEGLNTSLQVAKQGNQDLATRAGHLAFNTINGTYQHYDKELFLSEHAEGQLLSRLGIPTKYFRKCPRDLQLQNFDYWASVNQNKDLLLRLTYNNNVRAVFSTRYSTDLDDYKVLPKILKCLYYSFTDTVDLGRLEIDKQDDFTQLTVNLDNEVAVLGDRTFHACIMIINSEVGKSSLQIAPAIILNNHFTYGPLGRRLIADKKEGITRIRHTGQLKQEQIEKAVLKAKKAASVGIYQLMQTEKEIVEDPLQEVKEIVESSDVLTGRLVEMLEESYQHQQNITRLQLIEDMLGAIQHLDTFKRHLAAQEIGRKINLFSDTEKRFKQIVDDLDQFEGIEIE